MTETVLLSRLLKGRFPNDARFFSRSHSRGDCWIRGRLGRLSTAYESSTGASVFRRRVDKWLFSTASGMIRGVNIEAEEERLRADVCLCLLKTGWNTDRASSVTLQGSQPVHLGSSNDSESISPAGVQMGRTTGGKQRRSSRQPLLRLLSGALTTSGSMRRYRLPTEVARWFAKAPSTAPRLGRRYQDAENHLQESWRGLQQQDHGLPCPLVQEFPNSPNHLLSRFSGGSVSAVHTSNMSRVVP